ncbi:MAG TPA: hypothetical protein VHW47_10235 [Acidimicrobiales bacterium]|nr:hypothetical protein [Acidimicrobiales bacterium]
MAGGTTRYRTAYNAGSTGRPLPEGLASMADQDALIDQAHDAGRQGTDYDEWHAANVKPAAGPRGKPGRPGRSGRPGRRGGGGSSSPRSPRRPSGPGPSLARPFAGGFRQLATAEGAAGAFMGAVTFALLLSVAQYGAKGPGLWFKAKFLNQAATKGGQAPSAEGPTTQGAFKEGP